MSKESKPKYRVGDVLWVQQNWRTERRFDAVKPTMLPFGARIYFEGDPSPAEDFTLGKLRPGRFLPLRFARPARYEVVAVRCERVNEISEADAMAEGVTDEMPCGYLDDKAGKPMKECTAKCRFKGLWNSIHKEPVTRFEDAPWVFAYAFKKII